MTRCCKCGDTMEPSVEYIKYGATIGKYGVSYDAALAYYTSDPTFPHFLHAKTEHLSKSCICCGYTYFTPIYNG